MRELYRKVHAELSTLCFTSIWPEFLQIEYALYNNNMVCLIDSEIPYNQSFNGNTSIDYKGTQLAIWFVDDPESEDVKILAANLVHEMFHAYQKNHNETRFTNDLKGLIRPDDAIYYQLKWDEARALISALDTDDVEKKRVFLSRFLSMRKQRIVLYPKATAYELGIETIEGSAEYCGLKALEQLSFQRYYKRIDEYKSLISKDKKMLFDTRRYCYYFGALFLLLAVESNIPFQQEISGQKMTIYEEVASKCPETAGDYILIEDPDIVQLAAESKKLKETLFTRFFETESVSVTGNFTICGYDPMNMIMNNNRILHSRFVMLHNHSTDENTFLNGPIVTELAENTYNQVVQYWQQ